MQTLNQIILWLQRAIFLGLALRMAVICIKLIANEEEKAQNVRRLKHCIIAAAIAASIVALKTLIGAYFGRVGL